MEFKFKVQQYQTLAADAVADVFEGQPKVDGQQFVRDLGAGFYNKKGQAFIGNFDGLDVDASDGYKNAPLTMGPDVLLDNIKKVHDSRVSELVTFTVCSVTVNV